MKFTNRYGLPSTLVNLAENDPYTKGEADFSVTQLLDPPKISILQERHDDEIERDITDNMWALVGRAVHNVCEGGAEDHHIVEERLFMLVDGYTVSGAIDVQEEVGSTTNIYDYKFTSAYSVMRQKIQWEQQLNMYAQLIRSCKAREIGKLYIVAIVRDWNRHKVGQHLYPNSPVVVVPIRKWLPTECMSYIKERVNIHADARSKDSLGADLPECSDEERWKRPDTYAIYSGSISGRAVKVVSSQGEADDYIKSRGAGEMVVEQRIGPCARCEGNWCMVRDWCDQWFDSKKEGIE